MALVSSSSPCRQGGMGSKLEDPRFSPSLYGFYGIWILTNEFVDNCNLEKNNLIFI
jgi:hypothetical protein